jgi:hypothetical protein
VIISGYSTEDILYSMLHQNNYEQGAKCVFRLPDSNPQESSTYLLEILEILHVFYLLRQHSVKKELILICMF